MPEDKKAPKGPHTIILEDRRNLSITGVTDIDSFDEETVIVYTDTGELVVHGSGLHINKIDVDTGELTWNGEVTGMTYNAQPAVPGRPICPHVPLGRGKMEISVSSQTIAFLLSCLFGCRLGRSV